MRSPKERAVWAAVGVALLAGAAAAWWTADQWTPHAGPWARKTWLAVTRPPPRQPGVPAVPAQRGAAESGMPDSAPAPRKCVQGGRTTYTDKPCPAGSDELFLDPAVQVLRP